MKSTGIIRKIDELGRIVIPKEVRIKNNINDGDPIEIYVRGEEIILKKYTDCCVFCGSSEALVSFKDKYVCQSCKKEIIG